MNKSDIFKNLINNPFFEFEINDELKKDKEFCIKLIKLKPSYLKKMLPEFKSDKDFMLASVKIQGGLIKYASKEIKQDIDVIKEAIRQDPRVLIRYKRLNEEKENKFFIAINNELKKDKELVLEIVKKEPKLLKELDEIWGDNEEIASLAISVNPNTYKYISDRLKNKLIDKVIENKKFDFINAPKNLRGKKEIALKACLTNVFNHRYIDKNFFNDKEFYMPIYKKHPNILKLLNKTISDNEALEILKINENILNVLSEEQKGNKNFAIKAMDINLKTYFYLNVNLKMDKDIVLKAQPLKSININKIISHIYAENKEIMLKVFKDSPSLMEDGIFFKDDEDFLDIVLEQKKNYLKYMDDKFSTLENKKKLCENNPKLLYEFNFHNNFEIFNEICSTLKKKFDFLKADNIVSINNKQILLEINDLFIKYPDKLEKQKKLLNDTIKKIIREDDLLKVIDMSNNTNNSKKVLKI